MLRLCLLLLVPAAWCSQEYLLPRALAPTHYDIRLLYDVDPQTNFSFYGVVDITLKVLESTNKIALHAKDFNLSEQIRVAGPSDPKVLMTSQNDDYDILTLDLDQKLVQNENYTLTIPFYGNLKPGLDGVYISSYDDQKSGNKEYLVTTQFEAISARKGFPCFDEPAYKATFRIAVGHSRDFTAISNMPVAGTSDGAEMEPEWPWTTIQQTFKKDKATFVWDQFENSVPMSTYLVAFVVSKFEYTQSPPELSDTKFRIWARKDAISQTAYAADIGPKVLSYYEEFFNVSYPLPKQDMIAIPDFSAGAMENWGLITYRETALLYDKNQSSFTNKERVAEVIAHELAHQWFGNLVTMKWWSDLWLNEGFATYVASLGMAAVEPQWNSINANGIQYMLSAMNLDALESSHPVVMPLDDPKRISEMFDEISYRKGSTIIRMMSMFLGQEVFRTALHNYLTKYSYQNAEQDDLWRELSVASAALSAGGAGGAEDAGGAVDVKRVMDTWTTQTGFPLLTVTRDYGSGSIQVTQKRYLDIDTQRSSSSSWWVPLTILSEGDREQRPLRWLAANEGVSEPHGMALDVKNDEWVLFNADMIAPYRVNYDARNWQMLVNTLTSSRYKTIPAVARVQLVNDAFALSWSGRLNYTITMQLASYLQRESEYLPLNTALSALYKIETVLKRSPEYGAYQKFVRRLIAPAYRAAGGLHTKAILNGDNLDAVKMQTLTSSWACRMKVPGCEENAMQLFQSWMDVENPDENNPIPLDLRPTVYCVATSRGSVSHWRFLLARRRGTNVASARNAMQLGLACTKEVWILNQYLEWAITDGSEVRRQDALSVISSIARSSVGFYVARDFIYTRIEDIYNAFQGQSRGFGYFFKAMLDQFTTQKDLNEFIAWRDQNTKYLDGAKLAIDQAIEKARVNIAWLQHNKKTVVDKMREFAAPSSPPDAMSRWSDSGFMYSIFAIHNISSIRLFNTAPQL